MPYIIRIIFLIFLSGVYCQAQTINGIPVSEIPAQYIDIKAVSSGWTNLTILVDYGQENQNTKRKSTRILDDNGKNVEFESMIGALNFLYIHGFELVEVYVKVVNDVNFTHYILQKRKL